MDMDCSLPNEPPRCTPTVKQSVACSFPVEIIEAILADVRVPELIIAAAALPPFWRQVIESSTQIRKRITSHEIQTTRHFETGQLARVQDWTCDFRFFDCPLSNGTLYIHQRIQNDAEGLIFAPNAAELPLRILDPANKTVKYTVGGWSGYGFIDLRDMDGLLVCSKDVCSADEDALSMYVKACATGAPTEMKKAARNRVRGKKRKAAEKDRELHRPKKIGKDRRKKARTSTAIRSEEHARLRTQWRWGDDWCDE